MDVQNHPTRECVEKFNQRGSSLFLVLLLSGDIAFVVLHCINILAPGLKIPLLSLETDQGYAEVYQYLKWLWILIILVLVSLKDASLQYIAWILVFTYFLLDDALQVHERVGETIAVNLHFIPSFGLKRQDVGELVVSATVGIILLVPLLWAYKTGNGIFKKVSQDFALLILVLVFFGVVVDLAHSAINLGTEIGLLIGLIEDGGEMVTVSFILWYVFYMMTDEGEPDCYLCDCVRTFLPKGIVRSLF